MLKSACRLAGGAKPVSWLLFSDVPMTGPSPVAVGEGPLALVSKHPLLPRYLAS